MKKVLFAGLAVLLLVSFLAFSAMPLLVSADGLAVFQSFSGSGLLSGYQFPAQVSSGYNTGKPDFVEWVTSSGFTQYYDFEFPSGVNSGIYELGKRYALKGATGTVTFTVPDGAKYVSVLVYNQQDKRSGDWGSSSPHTGIQEQTMSQTVNVPMGDKDFSRSYPYTDGQMSGQLDVSGYVLQSDAKQITISLDFQNYVTLESGSTSTSITTPSWKCPIFVPIFFTEDDTSSGSGSGGGSEWTCNCAEYLEQIISLLNEEKTARDELYDYLLGSSSEEVEYTVIPASVLQLSASGVRLPTLGLDSTPYPQAVETIQEKLRALSPAFSNASAYSVNSSASAYPSYYGINPRQTGGIDFGSFDYILLPQIYVYSGDFYKTVSSFSTERQIPELFPPGIADSSSRYVKVLSVSVSIAKGGSDFRYYLDKNQSVPDQDFSSWTSSDVVDVRGQFFASDLVGVKVTSSSSIGYLQQLMDKLDNIESLLNELVNGGAEVPDFPSEPGNQSEIDGFLSQQEQQKDEQSSALAGVVSAGMGSGFAELSAPFDDIQSVVDQSGAQGFFSGISWLWTVHPMASVMISILLGFGTFALISRFMG